MFHANRKSTCMIKIMFLLYFLYILPLSFEKMSYFNIKIADVLKGHKSVK